MTMNEMMSVSDIKGIVRRRKKGFILCFLLIFFIAGVISLVLPPIYLSQSTILIENQQIPDDYVKSSITSYVEERLEMIKQQVMSRTKLMGIIEEFGLYREMRERYTTEETVAKMRDDINLETINADVMDRRTGRPSEATIAFTLSYEGKIPSTVQRVANVLASLYLEENLRTREQQASNTTAFLQQELDELKDQIDLFQDRISDFKKAHYGELPEFSSVNLQAVARLNRDLDQISIQIDLLKERKILLEGQLANVDPLLPVVTEDGKMAMNPQERLKYLRLELISLQGILTEKHPDIIRLRQSIQELESRVQGDDDSIGKVRRLNEVKGELADAEGRLGPKHPEVIKLSKEVENLSQEVEKLKVESAVFRLGEQEPDNPAYITLETQLASTQMEIESLEGQRKKIDQEISDYEKRLENAPMVEQEYNNLTRDYENAKFKYNEIMHKLMEARVAQGMEESQKGERFTIVEAAQLPEKPYKPNRMAIMLIGFVLALGAGVGIAAVRESLDISIKTADELFSLTGAPVLSVIPEMESDEEARARKRRTGIFIMAGIGAAAVAVILVHFYVMPLEILWIKIQKRMMMGV
jgi:succinoglycan biosynthesis transport protein ExoP